MQKIKDYISFHYNTLIRYVIFAVAVIGIVQVFPRYATFHYNYLRARPWVYEDLIAPFDFAILKDPIELEQEKNALLERFQPFYERDTSVVDKQKAFFSLQLEKYLENEIKTDDKVKTREDLLHGGFLILDTLFGKGIIEQDVSLALNSSHSGILLLEDQVASQHQVSDFLTLGQAFEKAVELAGRFNTGYRMQLINILEKSLVYNIIPDTVTTEKARQALLSNLSTTRGMVQQGEKIVSKGEIITNEKFQILESFHAEYLKQVGGNKQFLLMMTGQIILVSVALTLLALFLAFFRKDIYQSHKKLVLILLIIYLMVFLVSFFTKHRPDWISILPVCLVPILGKAFFDNRTALFIHVISMIIIGFMVPKSFEFIFLQLIAGIVAILSIAGMRRRSQLFLTVLLIFLSYSVTYTSLNLIQTGSFENIDPNQYLRYAMSALFTLFVYPLIFIFEKLFGLVTDFTLLELSDTNNPLLRELSMKAPGTFQHSLQVGNLAEEAVFKIGGNGLLVRTGALYHDIGKMDMPMYFIENQVSRINPHDELPYDESARIIINHVIKGIEKARKYKLPEYIIDFIRTHHGTTTTLYFYNMSLKNMPADVVNKNEFTYPGPVPFSKETAVLMMADSVEAASRSLTNIDEETISELVERIIDQQMALKQFENADITFRDISSIKRIFKKRLMNIYHVRLQYPEL